MLAMRSELTADQVLRVIAALEAAWDRDDKALAALVSGGSGERPLAVLVAEFGEIGVNPAYPAHHTVWLAETCERGLIHPVDELDVTFVPRMADLGMTALRRDATGKTAGHPAAA